MNLYPLTEREEREFGMQIRRKLNASTIELDKPVTDRLFMARQAAMAACPAPSPRLAITSVGQGLLSWSLENMRQVAVAAVLVVAILGGNYMMSVQHIEEMEEVDSALLSDDLPINAYLDSGFGSWLADSAQR